MTETKPDARSTDVQPDDIEAMRKRQNEEAHRAPYAIPASPTGHDSASTVISEEMIEAARRRDNLPPNCS